MFKGPRLIQKAIFKSPMLVDKNFFPGPWTNAKDGRGMVLYAHGKGVGKPCWLFHGPRQDLGKSYVKREWPSQNVILKASGFFENDILSRPRLLRRLLGLRAVSRGRDLSMAFRRAMSLLRNMVFKEIGFLEGPRLEWYLAC